MRRAKLDAVHGGTAYSCLGVKQSTMDDRRNDYQVDSRFHFAFLGLTKPSVPQGRKYTRSVLLTEHSVGVQRSPWLELPVCQDAIFDH
jgi:hypothetical protein